MTEWNSLWFTETAQTGALIQEVLTQNNPAFLLKVLTLQLLLSYRSGHAVTNIQQIHFLISNKDIHQIKPDICDIANFQNVIEATVGHKKNGIKINCTILYEIITMYTAVFSLKPVGNQIAYLPIRMPSISLTCSDMRVFN